MEFKQKAILKNSEGAVWGRYFLVDEKIANHFLKDNEKRLICTINQSLKIQAALLSFGNGNWGVLMNKENCKKLNLNLGDSFEVALEKDASKYGIAISEEVIEVLEQDFEGSQLFHQLTKGKQRSLLFIIEKPKSKDLKIRNAINVLNYLKLYNGHLDFKMLNEYLKNNK